MTQANASGKVRRGAGLLALICFLVLAGLGIRHVVHQPYFDIHHIEVTGDTSFTNVGALEKTLWEKLNGNYFFADLDPMRAAVEEVPWVASAKVERLWPDTIRVEIEKRRPIAIWGGTRLISDRGEIFALKNLDTPEAQGLPSFSGPDAMAHEVVEMYGPLSVTVEKLGAKIRDLSVTDRGSWSVVIEGGDIPSTKIELGRNTRDSRVQDRLELVAAHYQEVSRMMGGPPGSIDARYVNAFAATLPRERPKTDAQPSDPGTAAGSAKPAAAAGPGPAGADRAGTTRKGPSV